MHIVIASWGGERRANPYLKTFIPDHVNWIRRLKFREVGAVTIVDAVAESTHPDHLPALDQARRMGCRVFRRRNSRWSYGAYNYAFKKLRSESFSHWMFLEDDYVPIVDNFDSLLMDLYESMFPGEVVGYLCGLWTKPIGISKRRGTCSNGVVSVRSKGFEERGWPIRQGEFTRAFGPVVDYSDRFMSIFYRGWKEKFSERISVRGSALEPIIAPVQCLGIPGPVFWELAENFYEGKRNV